MSEYNIVYIYITSNLQINKSGDVFKPFTDSLHKMPE